MLLLIMLSTMLHSYDNAQKRVMGEYTAPGTGGLATAQFTKPLSPATINNNGTQKIKRAGYYFLTDNLMFFPLQLWSPNKPSINWQDETTPHAILCISTDNIIVDLNRKTISQATDNNQSFQQPNLVGIYVKPGVKNVTIKNGTINGLSGCGILIGANCKNICIDNVSVINCSMAGIIVGHNPFAATYTSVHDGFEKIQYFDPETCIANSTEDVTITNCSISGTSGYYTYVDANSVQKYVYSHAIGLFAADCKNMQIENSIFNSNRYAAPNGVKNSTDDPGGYYHATKQGYNAYGLSLLRCKGGVIKNCQSANNAGWAAYGFHLQNSSGIAYKDCHAQHNYAEGDPLQHKTLLTTNFDWSHRYLGRSVGFMMKDSSAHASDCSAIGNKGHREAVGFWAKRDTILTSPSTATIPSCNDATLFTPVGSTYTACKQTVLMTDMGALILPNYSDIAANPPNKGTGYTIPTLPRYVLDSGSSGNVFINCASSAQVSVYLDAYGFLAEGNSNNIFEQCSANNNHAGKGTEDYQPGGLADYDNGVGVWSLAEYDRYKNSFTNKVVRFGVGFCTRSTRIPISEWDGLDEVYKLYKISDELVFLGVTIENSDPTLKVILHWPEIASSVDQSTARDNVGDIAGPGVGVLLNGADKNRISKSWLYANNSNTSGTTVDATEGIGAHGGYGLLDINENSTSLILENYAFANQIVRPKIITDAGPPVVTDWARFIEGSNYHIRYTDVDQNIPLNEATIGDFSSLVTAMPFTNYEWQTTAVASPYSVKNKILVESVPVIYTTP